MTPERWRAITEIFHDAMAREPAIRDGFLAEACKDDASLKAEVEAMLAAHDAAGSFGETGIVPGAIKQLAPGTQLGAYRIETLLGSGGMGEVYRARDSKLGRDVALKILPTHLTFDPERRARLTREARLLATLSHQHIAAIYGLEETHGVIAYDEIRRIVPTPANVIRPTRLIRCLRRRRWAPSLQDSPAGCGRRLRPLRPPIWPRRAGEFEMNLWNRQACADTGHACVGW